MFWKNNSLAITIKWFNILTYLSVKQDIKQVNMNIDTTVIDQRTEEN